MTRFVGVILLVLVAGCTSAPPPSPPTAPPTAPSASPSSGSLDCGTFTLGQGEGLPDTAMTCFLDAHRAKREARLERTAPSVEGYPIREEYVTDAGGMIDATFDMSKDPFGGFRIDRRVCSEVDVDKFGRLNFDGCTPA